MSSPMTVEEYRELRRLLAKLRVGNGLDDGTVYHGREIDVIDKDAVVNLEFLLPDDPDAARVPANDEPQALLCRTCGRGSVAHRGTDPSPRRQDATIATVLDTLADELATKAPTTPSASHAVWTATVELIRGYAGQARRTASPVFSVITLLEGLRQTLDDTRRFSASMDQRRALAELSNELGSVTAGFDHKVELLPAGQRYHVVIVRAQDESAAAQRARSLDPRYLVSTDVPDAEILDVAYVTEILF
jgi:hypothetical protein